MSYQPDAAYRRVELYIETELKPEYKDANGQPVFSLIPRDHFPDIWYFKLWKCCIVGNQWHFVPYRDDKVVYTNSELLDVVEQDSRQHFQIQATIVEKLNNGEGWMCLHNRVHGACRLCSPSVQSVVRREPTLEQMFDDLTSDLKESQYCWEVLRDSLEMKDYTKVQQVAILRQYVGRITLTINPELHAYRVVEECIAAVMSPRSPYDSLLSQSDLPDDWESTGSGLQFDDPPEIQAAEDVRSWFVSPHENVLKLLEPYQTSFMGHVRRAICRKAVDNAWKPFVTTPIEYMVKFLTPTVWVGMAATFCITGAHRFVHRMITSYYQEDRKSVV